MSLPVDQIIKLTKVVEGTRGLPNLKPLHDAAISELERLAREELKPTPAPVRPPASEIPTRPPATEIERKI